MYTGDCDFLFFHTTDTLENRGPRKSKKDHDGYWFYGSGDAVADVYFLPLNALAL